MDDTVLNQLILDLPEKCVALMEDIDAAFRPGFTRGLPRQSQSQAANGDNDPSVQQSKGEESGCRVTLSGLLNALDGVGAQEGRILYATTNCYDALDPALCRPGRMDVHMEFKLASKYQVRRLFERFYMSPVSEDNDDDKNDGEEKDDTDTEDIIDSGFSSPTLSVSENLITFESVESPNHGPPTDISEMPCTKEKACSNVTRPSPPLPSRRQTRRLAARFAEIIPDREFSMASLQGYLMTYKTRPYDSVRDATAWVEAHCMNKAGHETDGEIIGDRNIISRGVGTTDIGE